MLPAKTTTRYLKCKHCGTPGGQLSTPFAEDAALDRLQRTYVCPSCIATANGSKLAELQAAKYPHLQVHEEDEECHNCGAILAAEAGGWCRQDPDFLQAIEEPFFLIRAQDRLAPPVIEEWLRRYRDVTYYSDNGPEKEAAARVVLETIRAWQAVNPDRVKHPD